MKEKEKKLLIERGGVVISKAQPPTRSERPKRKPLAGEEIGW